MPNRELIFATKETIKQPVGGLIVEPPDEQDHILGASGPDFEVLIPSGQWHEHLPIPELQRNRHGDTFMCVSFSLNNIHEMLKNRLFGEVINKSDLFLGVGSGTVRGRGNSKRAVAEWNRRNGFVLESEYPYHEDMTLDEAYKPLTRELLTEGIKSLEDWVFNWKWLGSNDPEVMKEGLKLSPLQVDVWGSYRLNRKGYVSWASGAYYNHEVVIFGYQEGEYWLVFDSETDQFLYFDWNYPFGSPMIHAVKKNSKIRLFKKRGQAGIAVKHVSEASMIVFSGGSVKGGDLFLSLYGVQKFEDIQLIYVDEWPHPIRHMINTNPYR